MANKIIEVKIIKKSSDKTVVGIFEYLIKHKLGKYIKRKKKYIIHDENNVAKVDSVYSIQESRPISKKKNWILINNENIDS